MSDTCDRPLSVLIVEDEKDTADTTAELVTLCGHNVRLAETAPAALKAIVSEAPDVVLLDIGLPGMDGWNLAAQLREQAGRKQPIIVAVTGYADDLARWRSADAGVDLHWAKPADPAALARLLQWIGEVLSARQPIGSL